jgi:glucan phosphoethanolaminetransferase (alkaline phosphatase superfamily)
MDFQELSTLWNSNDQELDRQIEIRQRLVKEVGIYKVRTYLSEIKWTAYFELAISLIFLPFIGRYLADTFSETKFFLPGLLLFAFLIFSVGISSYQLTLYYGIRAGYSVVQTQLKVARLKYMELLDINLLLIIIPLFFAPFMIVMAKALANYDLYRHSQWLISSTLGSVVVALVVVFFLRKFPNERLQEAQDFLNDLKEEE